MLRLRRTVSVTSLWSGFSHPVQSNEGLEVMKMLSSGIEWSVGPVCRVEKATILQAANAEQIRSSFR
jgi:hypothetical protein